MQVLDPYHEMHRLYPGELLLLGLGTPDPAHVFDFILSRNPVLFEDLISAEQEKLGVSNRIVTFCETFCGNRTRERGRITRMTLLGF